MICLQKELCLSEVYIPRELRKFTVKNKFKIVVIGLTFRIEQILSKRKTK